MVVETNGLELNYEITGDGEPLLWLHGFMGAGPDWKYIFNEPPAGFRVIAPDLRGHGASTNPSGQFSFRQAAEDVEGLLNHLGLDRVKAIGLSGGGIALLHLASPARPHRVDGARERAALFSNAGSRTPGAGFGIDVRRGRVGSDAEASPTWRRAARAVVRTRPGAGRPVRRRELHAAISWNDQRRDTHRLWGSRSVVSRLTRI